MTLEAAGRPVDSYFVDFWVPRATFSAGHDTDDVLIKYGTFHILRKEAMNADVLV